VQDCNLVGTRHFPERRLSVSKSLRPVSGTSMTTFGLMSTCLDVWETKVSSAELPMSLSDCTHVFQSYTTVRSLAHVAYQPFRRRWPQSACFHLDPRLPLQSPFLSRTLLLSPHFLQTPSLHQSFSPFRVVPSHKHESNDEYVPTHFFMVRYVQRNPSICFPPTRPFLCPPRGFATVPPLPTHVVDEYDSASGCHLFSTCSI
jgi:hypothetical protein